MGHQAGQNVTGDNNIAFGTSAGNNVTASRTISIGNAAAATADDAIAVGTSAVANSASAVAIGNTSTATGGQAVSIGTANTASGNGAVAIGDPNVATGTGAVALGANNTATGQGAVGLGNQNSATGQGSVAIGNTSVASGAGSIAFGDTANASANGGVALGSGAVADRAGLNGATELFSNVAVSSTAGAVSVGAPGAERQITNVAGGTQDTDAVNVRQLKWVHDNAVNYDINPDGTINYNSVTLNPGGLPVGIHNLAPGVVGPNSLDAVNGSQLYNLKNDLTNSIDQVQQNLDKTNQTLNQTNQTVKQIQAVPPSTTGGDKWVTGNPTTYTAPVATGVDSTAIGSGAQSSGRNSVALGNGSSDGGQDNVVSIGSAGNERRIVNVAKGVNGTDGVNVSQLNDAINQTTDNFNQQLGGIRQDVNNLARNAYGGIAAATALTMIPEVDKDKTIAVGVGGGTYRGYQAVAIGATARITENIKFRAGVGMSSGGTTAGVGASMQW
ncbi:hypothetical protein WS46_08260 [Burkholderia sp. RF4-BP95]|nr:hypothetical protein WS46_08260 [Burkholderia sp. RF4-BP95]